MKVIKYFLIGVLLLVLWVTAPLWMPQSYDSLPEQSSVDAYVLDQKEQRNTLLKAQDMKFSKLEEQFGKQSDVMKAIKSYWAYTYSHGDAFELLRCTKIQAGAKGWTTVCSFRLKSVMQQDSYTVNNGFVSK